MDNDLPHSHQQAEGDHIAQADQGSTAIVGDANVVGDGSTAIKAEGEAVVATQGGVAARQVAVGGDVHGDVTVIVQGKNVRDKELAYLDGLLKRYEFWCDHYTPLAGIAEVRAAVQDGPRLDLPMPFVPRVDSI